MAISRRDLCETKKNILKSNVICGKRRDYDDNFEQVIEIFNDVINDRPDQKRNITKLTLLPLCNYKIVMFFLFYRRCKSL